MSDIDKAITIGAVFGILIGLLVGVLIGGSVPSGETRTQNNKCETTCGYRKVAAVGHTDTNPYCLCSEADGGVSTEVAK